MGGDIHNVELKESSTNSMLIDALYSWQLACPLLRLAMSKLFVRFR